MPCTISNISDRGESNPRMPASDTKFKCPNTTVDRRVPARSAIAAKRHLLRRYERYLVRPTSIRFSTTPALAESFKTSSVTFQPRHAAISSSAFTRLRLNVWIPPGGPHRSVSRATTCLPATSLLECNRLSDTATAAMPPASHAGRLGGDHQRPGSRPMDTAAFESLPDRLDSRSPE